MLILSEFTMNFKEAATKLVDSIRNDYFNGSMTIARNALLGLLDIWHSYKNIEPGALYELFEELKRAKPSMHALKNVVSILQKNLGESGIELFETLLNRLIQDLELSTSEAISNAVVYVCSRYTKNNLVVATTTYSSTFVKFIKALNAKKDLRLFILESKWNDYDYSSTTLQQVQNIGVEAEVINEDGMVERFNSIDFAATGADCVSPGKGIVNGTPTSKLAKYCQQQCIPFYVVAESLKFSKECVAEAGFDFVEINLITRIFTDSKFTDFEV